MTDATWGTAAQDIFRDGIAAMRGIVVELTDDLVNERPDLPGANSPYVIAHHTVAAIAFWLGTVIGGEQIPRDRGGEFTARGTVAEVVAELDDLGARLSSWVDLAADGTVRNRAAVGTTRVRELADAPPEWMVVHAVREMSQHLGQLELTRDVLTAPDHGASRPGTAD